MKKNEFLTYFPDCCIQTFDDRGDREKCANLAKCDKLSNFSDMDLFSLNSKGAGIFFSVNKFPSGKRGTDFCQGINAWYAECDDLSIEEQWANVDKSPLQPSFIVRSKKSLHLYWLAKDATKEKFIEIQLGLRDFFHGDNSMRDISRVLRLPGYYHQKDPLNPFLVKLQKTNPDVVYPQSEMLENFPHKEEVKAVKLDKNNVIKIDDIWETISRINNRTVLTKLSGSDIVNGENLTFSPRSTGGEYILVDGKSCDAWIDEDGLIGSGKGGGPTWIQWVSYYGKSKSDILRWARYNLSEFIPKKEQMVDNKDIRISTGDDVVKSRLLKILERPKSPYTWGSDFLDNELPVIEPWSYIVMFGSSNSGKTLFTFWMAMQNAKKMERVTFLTLEMSTDQLIMRYCKQKANVSKEEYRLRQYNPSDVAQWVDDVKNLDIVGVDEGENYDVGKIDVLLDRYKPSMLFIDNLNKISGTGTEMEASASKSEAILKMTRNRQIPVVLIHHANKMFKDSDKEGFNLRGLSGLRGTNKIVDDADIIIEVARPKYIYNQDENTANENHLLEPNSCCLSGYKDRDNDARGFVKVYFDNAAYRDENDWKNKGSSQDSLSYLLNS
jgi:hypothetical protein